MRSGGFLPVLLFSGVLEQMQVGFFFQRPKGGEPFLTRAGKNGRQVHWVSSRKLQEEAAWSWH